MSFYLRAARNDVRTLKQSGELDGRLKEIRNIVTAMQSKELGKTEPKKPKKHQSLWDRVQELERELEKIKRERDGEDLKEMA